jgi:hypothetical protein
MRNDVLSSFVLSCDGLSLTALGEGDAAAGAPPGPKSTQHRRSFASALQRPKGHPASAPPPLWRPLHLCSSAVLERKGGGEGTSQWGSSIHQLLRRRGLHRHEGPDAQWSSAASSVPPLSESQVWNRRFCLEFVSLPRAK